LTLSANALTIELHSFPAHFYQPILFVVHVYISSNLNRYLLFICNLNTLTVCFNQFIWQNLLLKIFVYFYVMQFEAENKMWFSYLLPSISCIYPTISFYCKMKFVRNVPTFKPSTILQPKLKMSTSGT
jgi:hypothetical protein